MHNGSDEELMDLYRQGNVAAFDELYSRYRQPLYRFILRQVGEPATANDLYQGSWEKIIQARDQFRSSQSFRAWMYRIARNHVIDGFRRMKPDTDLADQVLESHERLPDEQMEQGERQSALKRAILDLPPEQREVIMLRLEGGLDIATIAKITGVNPETAKSRLRYAVNKLQACTQEYTQPAHPEPAAPNEGPTDSRSMRKRYE